MGVFVVAAPLSVPAEAAAALAAQVAALRDAALD